MYTLGGVLAAYGSQFGPLAAIALPLLVCGAIGLVSGLLVARLNLAPFIVTLATLLFARGLLPALTSEGSTTYTISDPFVLGLGRASFLGLGVPVWIALVLCGVGGIVLQRTRFGETLDAIAAVVIGGTLLTGGAGSVLGTLVGVLLRNVLSNVINQIGGLDSNVQSVISGAFLLVVVVAQRLLARTLLGPRRRRLIGVEDGEETFDAAAESGPDVGGAVEMCSGHGSVAHHEEVLRCVLGLAAPR